MAAPIVIFDPNTPVGTEPLKLGPLRFQEIKSSLLREVQLPDGVFGQFAAPFSFDLTNDPIALAAAKAAGLLSVLDPVADQGIATKHIVDAKVSYGQVADAPSPCVLYTTYFGDLTPVFATAPRPGSLIVVTNGGSTNAGPVGLGLASVRGGVLPLRNAAGGDLVAGDFVTASTYLLMVAANGTHYIMVGTTKGYVDAAAGAVVSDRKSVV